MKKYQDYWFHIKGSLTGQAFGLPAAPLVGGLTMVIIWLGEGGMNLT